MRENRCDRILELIDACLDAAERRTQRAADTAPDAPTGTGPPEAA